VDGVFTDFANTARPVADRLFAADVPGALAGRGTRGSAGDEHGGEQAVRDALFSGWGEDATGDGIARPRGRSRR